MQDLNLTDHFLIAMPGMVDPIFSKSLMYICEHHEQGALGITINKPIAMNLSTMLSEIGITSKTEFEMVPVYFGGPVEIERGFVLHDPIGSWQSSLPVAQSMGLTTSKDILTSMGEGDGPENFIVALGYAGWSPGQLEHELSENAWLSVRASKHILFNLPPEERFGAALQALGIDMTSLSDAAGHA